MTHAKLDYENDSPGPQIHLMVECSVHAPGNLLGRPHRHAVQVNVIDQNDNGPKLQEDKKHEITIGYKHFRKVGRIKFYSFIILH